MCNMTCDGIVDVPGCMDVGADNYNPSATIDDGNCTYTCGDGLIGIPETCDE